MADEKWTNVTFPEDVRHYPLKRKVAVSVFRNVPLVMRQAMRIIKPGHMIVETVNSCNLRCPLCWVPEMERARGIMSTENFVSLIDQLPQGMSLSPYNAGEPLIDKEIWKKIRHASGRDMHTTLSTNGMLLNRFEPQEVFGSGVGQISVTIDSTRSAVHEGYRVGSKLETVVKNLGDLCAARRGLGATRTKISIVTVLTRKNEDETDDIAALGRELGVDQVNFKTAHLNRDASQAERDEWLPRNPNISRYARDDSYAKEMVRYGCNAIRAPTVFWNGDLTVCCFDFEGRHVIGNVFKTPFRELWNSTRYHELRKNVLRRSLSICKDCYAF